jgi:hypothetical protein
MFGTEDFENSDVMIYIFNIFIRSQAQVGSVAVNKFYIKTSLGSE